MRGMREGMEKRREMWYRGEVMREKREGKGER